MKKVKIFYNIKDVNDYLKSGAEDGEVIEMNEVATITHPKRITRFVKEEMKRDKCRLCKEKERMLTTELCLDCNYAIAKRVHEIAIKSLSDAGFYGEDAK